MAIKTIKTYICDVCKFESENNKDIKKIVLPYKESDCEGRTFHLNYKEFDLCHTCETVYTNLIFNNFAYIKDTVGYYDFTKKY